MVRILTPETQRAVPPAPRWEPLARQRVNQESRAWYHRCPENMTLVMTERQIADLHGCPWCESSPVPIQGEMFE